MFDAARETDIEVLRAACLGYEKAFRELTAKVEKMAQQLAALQGLDRAQLGLELPDIRMAIGPTPVAEPAPAARPERAAQKGHGPTAQPRLPIEPVEHRFEASPSCGQCGATMAEMAGQFEESEEITVVETSFKIRLHRRQKYRCRCNAQVLTAPAPPKLVPGGRYSVDFAAHVAVGKFCDHCPLERQVGIFGRQGLYLTSQALWDQLQALAELLRPTWQALCDFALAQPVLHVDETGWRMWSGADSPKWTLFGLTSPLVAAYHLTPSKSARTVERLLGGFGGTLVVDGFAVYPIVAKLHGLTIAHCWAHADRKFKEATDPPEAVAKIRGWIAELYAIEREVESPFPGDELALARRRALRAERSAPIVAQIRELALTQGGLRRSDFGKALRYLLKYWKGLTVFLDDPRVPLDNNAAERALRGPVLGRKNFYGNRSEKGAEVAAILYSLIESAKLHGLDPEKYLAQAAYAALAQPGKVTLPFA